MKKLLALLTVLVLSLSLAACGGKSASDEATAIQDQRYSTGTYAYDGDMAPAAMENGKSEAITGGGQDTGSKLIRPADDRKIIYTANVDMEATDFDASVAALYEALSQAGGYVASSNIRAAGSTYARRATYEFRVPADKYADFLAALAGAGNVTYQYEQAEDITAQYVDVEARLSSLQLQETRLLEMMASAGTLETLLAIQNQLTEVQYQIESFTATRRAYDSLLSYSTVTVELNEVKSITAVKDTFGQRIVAAFGESWRDFADGCQNFAVWFVYAFPTLLVLAALLAAVVYLFRARRKKNGPGKPLFGRRKKADGNNTPVNSAGPEAAAPKTEE